MSVIDSESSQFEIMWEPCFLGIFQNGGRRVRSKFSTLPKIVVEGRMRALWKGIDAHNTNQK